ncbi:hypothetical protein GXW78_15650 [Roseomonas terrae]|jgi:hypothetical protein|uniref:Uncharacterized protein n=1 Tax=Neoroseomonas terrae TaxID=424799 RepID=A0ABS5EJB7_9PROT|nr:hypothetical protein [Neoroseomonas terrae]MBR0651106.1 hypothetical protein [Neoroseomonas terrae]
MSAHRPVAPTVAGTVESDVSAVSWAAIIAGGLTAVAATLILTMVSAGVGFASISPWSGEGAAASTIAIGSVVALVIVQWISSGLGGYVAGRLRTTWTGLHRDEVFFRDTVHGLLAWALATVLGILLASSALTSLVGAGARGAAAVSQGAVSAAASAVGPVSQYDLDTLLRPARPGATPSAGELPDVGPEVMRILANGITAGDVPSGDRDYLAQIVAARSEISAADARQRVDAAVERAKQAAVRAQEAADTARKTAATLALLGALALLIGAFIASAAAAYGGQLRDE